MTPLPISLRKLTVAEYALAAQALGENVVEVNGCWWREVRPFFFRPVLPYLEFGAGVCHLPRRASVGGAQYCVPAGQDANSAINLLIFPHADAYSTAALNWTRRRELKTAEKRYSIRLFEGLDEFLQKAHSVYISFFKRTHYKYLSNRLEKERFGSWATAIFSQPGPIVLGAFAGDELGAVSISHVVETTMAYSTFFADEEALRCGVSSLMLHTVRSAAAADGSINQIFVGLRKQGVAQSVDNFYLMRGCSIQAKPAKLALNAIAHCFMQAFRPSLLRHMLGKNYVATYPTEAGTPTPTS